MSRKKLPIGVESFSELREYDYYYVDKTHYIMRLLDDGKHFFLSRPRRFGKTLLLDTLKELFEGNKTLFERLSIHDKWDWSQRYPVIRLNFGRGSVRTHEDLQNNIELQLNRLEDEFGLSIRGCKGPERLSELILELHKSTGDRVVVLVDEYDKPIVDALNAPEIANTNRDYLHDLYSVIKGCNAQIRFSFITGVSKFTKVSLFSGLNNLIDITIEPNYSSICGYTEKDLETVFAAELPGFEREKIREWYNGYSWRGEDKVYNPFDILFLFRRREFGSYWFETGTPKFLVETLFRRRVSSIDLGGMIASNELLSSFDVDQIAPEALLFQTGYLTIEGTVIREDETFYRLGFPNREVRQGLNQSLLEYMVGGTSLRESHRARFYELLRADNIEGLHEMICSFYASIPFEWFMKNDIANYEGYYVSVFFGYFVGLGLDVAVEDRSHFGRIDMVLRFHNRIYLFEFKVVEQAGQGTAMAQLNQRGYAEKFRAEADKICLVGVEFSSEIRNVVAFEVERL